jgi:O-antigen ligase
MFPITVEKRISNIIVFIGPVVSLAISPWMSFDPINPIKTLLLTSMSFAAFGLLIPYFSMLNQRIKRINLLILILFCSSLFSSFFFSGANKSQQFWGVFGRNTGILTYLSLVLILLLSAFISSKKTYERIVWSLITTVSIMSGYCLIQIAKLDPISWSAFFPFGTLGNVNFLSGFMGVGLVPIFVLATSSQLTVRRRLILGGLFILGSFVLLKSDSTQGVVALVVGISTYLLVRLWYVNRIIFIAALVSYLLGSIFLVLGLLDKGPFRTLIYQFTTLFRADYMLAGINMLLSNPLTGVGIDSYDDWYRTERGIISALRTSLNRTANSAHNISLDLAAGGGFPLLISYLALLAAILYSITKGFKKGFARDPIFLALSMAWLAYQVQASVSINQIGVGVWGWILGGSLLGYSTLSQEDYNLRILKGGKNNSKEKFRLNRGLPNTPPPLPLIVSTASLAIGFILAFLPFKTDIDFMQATNQGSAQDMLRISNRPTANTFMLTKASSAAFQAELTDVGTAITERLVTRFPRNIYGWMVIYEKSNFFGKKTDGAFQQISLIDPYVSICYLPNSALSFRAKLNSLPPMEKYKLARGWGMVGALTSAEVNSFSWELVAQDLLEAKISSFCGL